MYTKKYKFIETEQCVHLSYSDYGNLLSYSGIDDCSVSLLSTDDFPFKLIGNVNVLGVLKIVDLIY